MQWRLCSLLDLDRLSCLRGKSGLMLSYDLIHRRLLTSATNFTSANAEWVEAGTHRALPLGRVLCLLFLFRFLRLFCFESLRILTLVIGLGIEQFNVVGVVLIQGVHLLIILTEMTEAVGDDHHRVILTWLFLVRQELNVLFGVNDSHFVFLEKFE
jgi:hypothetical protein